MRIISFTLVLIMVFTSLPAGCFSVSAEEDAGSEAEQTDSSAAEPAGEEPYVIGEDVSRRGENEKHFLMSDGSSVAALYETDVHYRDETGAFQEIDNSFESAGDEYQTKEGKQKVKLAKKASAKKLVTIHTDGYKISWGFADAAKSRAEVQPMEENLIDDPFAVKNLTGEMRYSDVFDGVDLRYLVTPEGVKEDIVLKDRSARRSFSVYYDVGQLTARQKDSRTVELLAGETVVYEIIAPVMTDANGSFSDALALSLTEQKNGKLTVVLTADSAWLDDSARCYPVTVDPTVSTTLGSSVLDCKFTFNADPLSISNINDVYNISNITYVGWDVVLGDMTSLYYFKALPTLSKGDYVTNAVFALAGNQSIDFQINAYECTEQWTGNVTYAINYEPNYAEEIIDYVAPYSTFQWNITNLVRRWYNLGPDHYNNCGLMLKSDELVADYVAFASSGYSVAASRPILAIHYINCTGVEEYLSYTTADLMDGTAYVNNANGNLTVEIPLLSTRGENMPASLSLYYNGTKSSGHSRMIIGSGWQVNYDQRIDYITNAQIRENGYYYTYTDSDGTVHYMKKVGSEEKYTDEIGAGLTLTLNSNEWYLTDKSNNQRIFDSYGRLIRLKSAESPSVITVTYNSDGRIDVITDGSGDTIRFERNSNQAVTAVVDPYGRKISLSYSGSRLVSISGFDGSAVQFAYDNSNQITAVTSTTGERTAFEYWGSECEAWQSRVHKITEISEANESGERSEGNCVYLYYTDQGYTEVTDKNTNTAYYIFDEYGRSTNQFSDTGAVAQAYTTVTDQTATYTNNRISRTTATGTPVDNKAKNSSFESASDWWTWVSSSADASVQLDSTEQRIGFKSVKLSAQNNGSATYFQLYTPSVSGYYTYSVYYKTGGVTANEGISALLALVDNNGSKTYVRSQIETQSTKGQWQRLTVTAYVDASVISQIHIINGLHFASGCVYFDCAQLEYSETANEYNMLYNGAFNNGSSGWNLNASTYDGVRDIGSVIYAANQPAGFAKSMVLAGGREYQKNIVQEVNINKPASKVSLNFSAYAHGQASKEQGNGAYFALDLQFKYSDNTSEYIIRSFNIKNWSWQFLTELIVPSEQNKNKTVSSIRAFLIYYGQ